MVLAPAGRAMTAVLLAVLVVAACSHSAAPSATGSASPTVASPTVASPTPLAFAGSGCRQRYEKWTRKATTTAFKARLRYILSKEGADHVAHMTSVLERAGSAAPSLSLPPHCADPANYYSQVAVKIENIAENARSASGLGALLTAEAPLKSVKVIERELSTEVSQTVDETF
jgi:hypothetical protein